MVADPNINSERLAVLETTHQACKVIQLAQGESIKNMQIEIQTIKDGRIYDRAILLLVVILVIMSASDASPIGKILARFI